MNKQEKIEKFLKEDLKVGDEVIFSGEGNGSKNPKLKSLAKIDKIEGDLLYLSSRSIMGSIKKRITEVTKSTMHIGENPFRPRKIYQSYRIDINQLLWKCGYKEDGETIRTSNYYGYDMLRCTLDPVVTDSNGDDVSYQRDLVWNNDQKVNLIDSIYNGADLGKFIFRVRKLQWVKDRLDNGKKNGTALNDLVDGKQRINAILEFMNDGYKDSYGNFYSDLSDIAKNRLLGFGNLACVELPEEATDEETIDQFLIINKTGTIMSKEHLDFVEQVKL